MVGSIDQIEGAARKILPDAPGRGVPSTARNDRYLRPPGAVPADRFAETCAGCRACLVACPAQCIQMEEGEESMPVSAGPRQPHIVPRQGACVVCDDLACTHACPTGALQPLEAPEEIHMGWAVMDHDRCLRGLPEPGRPAPASGEACRVCLHHCPIGESALFIDDDGLVQVGEACVGCGMCEWSCQTVPASIEVMRGP